MTPVWPGRAYERQRHRHRAVRTAQREEADRWEPSESFPRRDAPAPPALATPEPPQQQTALDKEPT